MAASWSQDAFMTTLRTGVTPDGRQLDNAFMPWEAIGNMTDDDLTAVQLYLKTLP